MKFDVNSISEEQWYWIWLVSIDGVGAVTFSKLVKYCKSAQGVWQASANELLNSGVGEDLCRRVVLGRPTLGRVRDSITQAMVKYDFYPVFKNEGNYPANLGKIKHPPAVLWVHGPGSQLNIYPQVAIVGSRHTMAGTEDVVSEFVQALVSEGVAIISGLAKGVDSMAHKSTLEFGGSPIGVIGAGIVNACRPERPGLFSQVWKKGVILSHFQPFSSFSTMTFPQRNAVMAGMVDAVLVIQAKKKSGTLITVRAAEKYERPIYAPPGNVDAWLYKGSNKLISSGRAMMVIEPKDILTQLFGKQDYSKKPKKKEKDFSHHNLSPAQKEVLEAIKLGTHSTEEIAKRCSLDMSKFLCVLSELELDGLVENRAGEYFLGV